MKSEAIILFLVVIAATSIDGLSAQDGGELIIRFGPNLSSTEKLPLNTSMAISKSWVLAPPPQDTPFPDLQLWCYPDHVVCVWFYEDIIAGVQIAHVLEQISNAAFDFLIQGFLKWTVSGTELWVKSYYFLSPEVLSGKKTLEPSQYADQSIAANVILKQGFLWLQGFNGQFMAIPTTTSAVKDTLFTEEGCQDGKGTHYLYNFTKSGPECTADEILPSIPITHQGTLVAIELVVFATVDVPPEKRDWFERKPLSVIKGLLPVGPSCMNQLLDTNGLVGIQIFVVSNPENIICPIV